MTPQEAMLQWKQFMIDIGYGEQPDGSWIHSNDDGDVLNSEEARQERHEFAMNLMELAKTSEKSS